MNGLQKKQVEHLNSIGCADLARKVTELVSEFNKLKKPKEDIFGNEDDIVEVLWNCDTKSDLRRILNDYLKV